MKKVYLLGSLLVLSSSLVSARASISQTDDCGITVNGQCYDDLDGNLTITNEGVFSNGKKIAPIDQKLRPIINVVVKGNVQSVYNVKKLEVTGNTGSVQTTNGDVTVGQWVKGDVVTVNGNVTAENISGSVKTVNGDVAQKFKTY